MTRHAVTRRQLGMQAYWIQNNTSFLVRYWYTAGAALNKVKDAPASFEEFKHNDLGPNYVAAVVSQHLEHHNSAGVLLAYSHFEEFFATLTEDLGRMRGLSITPNDLRDRGVRRYRKFIHKVCQVTPDELPVEWQFLDDFATVRHCIVHANGNISKLADRIAFTRLVHRHSSELSLKHDIQLVVSDRFVVRCIAAVERASLALVDVMIRSVQPQED